MSRITIVLATVLGSMSVTFCPRPAAGGFSGHPVGPSDAEVSSILPSPWSAGEWFAGTVNAVYHLAPDASSWTYAGVGLPEGQVMTLAAGASHPGLIYAGIYGRGVYRSTDSGGGWIARNSGLANLSVYSLAVDPADPAVVWACTDAGIFRSTNAADSWSPRGLAGESIRDVAMDPAGGQRAWASVAWEGVYITTDAGVTWNPSSNGIGGNKLFYDIDTGATGSRLYAVGFDSYRSTDGGASWSEMGVGYWPSWQTIQQAAVRADDDNEVLVVTFGPEVFRSTDGGITWAEVGATGYGVIEHVCIASHGLEPPHVFAGALGGEIVASDNFGQDAESWSLRSDGISNATVLSFARREGLLLAGTYRGVYLSTNDGHRWEKSDLIYDIGAEINSIAIAPGDGHTVWCGNTNGFFKGDVHRSLDDGRHWTLVKNGDGPVMALAVDPADARRVYAGFSCDIAPGGVYRTTDGGASWITEALGSTCVYSLQIVPSSPGVILAGTSSGVWRSTDYGDTWTPRGINGIVVVDLSLDAAVPARIYAATRGARAQVSIDGGLSWSQLGGNTLPGILRCIDGTTPTAGVIAGSETAGIWRYSGGVWTQLPDAEQPRADDIRSILGNVPGNRFFAGTAGSGAWDYIPDPASADPWPGAPRFKVTVDGNPGRPPFLVRVDRCETGLLRIDVVDVTGRRVGGAENTNAGIAYSWPWEAEGIAPGVYFVRVWSVEGAATARIVCLSPGRSR